MTDSHAAKKLIFSLFLAFFVLSEVVVNAQDNHFTQFDYNPIFLNPANTGNFKGDWRVAGTYRNQWMKAGQPYRTATISADMPFYVVGQKIGAGILFLNDVAGPGQMAYNKIYLTGGYGYEYSNNFIRGGLQVGMAFGKVSDWNNWNRVDGEFNLPSGEGNNIGSAAYLDINLGLSWKRNINIFEPEAGFVLNHINAPKATFIGGAEKVQPRMTFYAKSKTKVTDEVYATPKIYFGAQNDAGMIVLGTDVGYKLLGNRSSVKQVFAGFYVRELAKSGLDAFMLQVGARVSRVDVAFSYDVGASALSNSSKMGSFEISFIYKSISTVLNSYSIPCERY